MLEKVKNILSDKFSIRPEEITGASSFKDDLGLDSLDLFEVVMELEEEYGFEIPTEKLAELRTVSDVVDYLESAGFKA